uniref:Partial AB-hydrolase lipase domain-containing protein n=1 Tax=Meloidogyne incognita TaxID=6306 RepID=A0A914N544_MELIC
MKLIYYLILIFILNNFVVLSNREKIFLIKELPEESLTTPEIIEYYGYKCEIHKVLTEDEYILEMHRIPFGRNFNEINKEPRRITNLPYQSLGFLLADAGFDVWLGNVRGNFYSSKHKKFTRKDPQYWNFSWDEMSSKDLPAMVDKALKIIKFFALAPVASVKHIKGLFAIIGKLFGKHLGILSWLFGSHEFLPHNWATQLFAKMICGQSWENPFCDNILFLIGGPETSQFNRSRLMVYMAHEPAGTSTKNIIHWSQMQQSGFVQKFNYGTAKANYLHYGQNTPPIYNLTKISNVPIYLYYSDSDWLATKKDVEETILQQIPSKYIKIAKNLPNFNHFDFIWGINANKIIYDEIIKEALKEE